MTSYIVCKCLCVLYGMLHAYKITKITPLSDYVVILCDVGAGAFTLIRITHDSFDSKLQLKYCILYHPHILIYISYIFNLY